MIPELPPPGGCPLHALFIGDDPGQVALELRELRTAWFTVTGDAVSTAQAFAGLGSCAYDVVICEYPLAGWNGLEAVRAVRRAGKDVPVILVSGALGEEELLECIRQGAGDVVLRHRLERLPAAVRRALEERALRESRRQAEEALRRSEANYRSLFQHASFGIARVSVEQDRFLAVNPALVEMLGYRSAADVLALSLSADVCACGGRNEGCLCAIPGRVVKDLEVEWKRRNGGRIMVRLNGRAVAGPQPAAMDLVAEDVTPRKQAQRRIAQLNRLYAVLSRVNAATVRVRDRDALFGEVCRIAVDEGLFRMAWIGLLDAGTSRVRPIAHAGYETGYLASVRDTASNVAEGGGPIGTSVRTGRHAISEDIANDPAMLPWRSQALERGYRCCGAFPIAVRGRVAGALSLYSFELGFFDRENVELLDRLTGDLSFALESMEAEQERRRAELELDHFFRLSLDLLAIMDFDGRPLRINAAWARALGFSMEELMGAAPLSLVHPDDAPAVRAELARLAEGSPTESFEARFRTRTGGYRWLSVNAAPAPARGAVYVACRDLTESKALADELQRTNLELREQNQRVQQATRLKSEFLANMSHEFRSPLNCIIGFSELVYDERPGALNGEQREYMQDILHSARHLLGLINDVLDLNRVECGRMEFHAEPVSLTPLVREVTDVLRALSSLKRIEVAAEVAPDADNAELDPARFKQVLYNYLSNALKFTPEGGSVTVRIAPEGDSELRLEVEDTGIGIEKDQVPRLFVEFGQLDAGTSKRFQGSGLGLALTKRLVTSQGGRVGVRSVPGLGSTFWAVLPRAAAKGAELGVR